MDHFAAGITRQVYAPHAIYGGGRVPTKINCGLNCVRPLEQRFLDTSLSRQAGPASQPNSSFLQVVMQQQPVQEVQNRIMHVRKAFPTYHIAGWFGLCFFLLSLFDCSLPRWMVGIDSE